MINAYCLEFPRVTLSSERSLGAAKLNPVYREETRNWIDVMVNYRRSKLPGGTYFFTVTLLNRQSTLLVDHIDLLKESIGKTKQTFPFKNLAMVVLPDHLHVIWQMPEGDDDYSKRWQKIKSHFTQGVLKKGLELKRNERGEYPLWQRRFWEHTIRDGIDLSNHINYIHYNPVRRHLVKNVIDWKYSTFHSYVKKKILPPDWGSDGECSSNCVIPLVTSNPN